ncbi:DUF421 domain-containing protein [Paramaledivibacter caminithermalis]|uniref:Uncharacterized membrane protein YcaP, DUF421 family n=1 Tax=Paramaledivibacter caminithermalis (strain DSM 15212 / CIP 107654 / DViRD3) TaxID=1121301 RepID=A0A1M6PW67_PARC5|nr:DUF421 domain-containing protein [Paramaledivibacter caminithermalis]SHK12138.1 Uncharacterized membrane protein YcaP, DUF421 family [Paramaledivibacter caminithermalis DSM 15212]
MLSLALKTTLLFVIGILIMRIMGKSAITQLTPYDLMAIIIIGTVIAEPLISTKLKPTLFVLGVLVVLYIVFSKLSLNQFFNKILLGRPTILIKHGKIIEENIEQERISLIQLTAILRVNGYPKLEDIEYAILEPTGEVSIIPKSDVRGVTPSDLNIKTKYEGLPIGVIIDGKVQKKNLKLINKDEKWLQDKIKEEGIQDINEIIYAYASDESEEVVFDKRKK